MIRFVLVVWMIVVGVWSQLLLFDDSETTVLVLGQAEAPVTTVGTVPDTTVKPAPVTTTSSTQAAKRTVAPVATTSTTAPAMPQAEPLHERECRAAIARSKSPLAPGWRELCTPAPISFTEGELGSAWAIYKERTIYYDAQKISSNGRSWRDVKGMWDYFVAHERCHSTRRWFEDETELMYEKRTDTCAAAYGARIHWSIYQEEAVR